MDSNSCGLTKPAHDAPSSPKRPLQRVPLRAVVRLCITVTALLLAVLLCLVATPARADSIYCVAHVSADKTSVCTGETVQITIDRTTCSNGVTIGAPMNYPTNFPTTGVYTISASCSACTNGIGTVSGSDSINIYVGLLNGISPSSATICPGNYMVFTAQSANASIPCGPTWSLSPTTFGSLSTNSGPSTTLTLYASANGSATLSAVCGSTVDTATITAAGSGTFAITTNPVSQVTCPGDNASLSVAATGSSPSYQWLWNGVIFTNGSYVILTNSPPVVLTNGGHISGATSATLTIGNVFATSSLSNSVPAGHSGGAPFGSLTAYDLYTYQATGCVTAHSLYMADPNGNTYTNGACSPANFFAPPAPADAGCQCPNLPQYSLVGYFNPGQCAQLGESGQLQAPSGIPLEIELCFNDNSASYDSGSWDATLTHTIEGVYSCIVSNAYGAMISTTATLYVSTPCDGIPDWWTIQNYGTTTENSYTCPTCISTNPWAHGLTNLQLYENPSVLISNNYTTYNDGIPDWWRVTYFGTATSNSQSCASCDADGSGLSNSNDYQCGFNPVSFISAPPGVASGTVYNAASVPPSDMGTVYIWSITNANGTITSGQHTPSITWNAGTVGVANICVTLSNSPSCIGTICANVVIGPPYYYVDCVNGLDSNLGTNWASAWKHWPGDPNAVGEPLITPLYPGDTVVISGGPSGGSQTYWLTNNVASAYPQLNLSGGTRNAPVTYMVGQDAGHNGTVVFNGGGIGEVGVGFSSFTTVDGGHGDGGNYLIVTNFIAAPGVTWGGTAFYCNGTITNAILRYVTVYNSVNLGINAGATGIEISHLIHYPPPGMTGESSNQAALFFSWTTPYPTNASYSSTAFVHDSTIYTYRHGTADGLGDVGINSPANTTISNVIFKTIVNSSLNDGKHQEAIQIGGQSWLRVMDCYFENQAGYGIFGGSSDPYAANNLQYFNNVFTYTDSVFTGANANVCVFMGNGGGTSTIHNVLIANNTMADANYGVWLGYYDPSDSIYSNVVIVNNICTNNNVAGISCVSQGGLTNSHVTCLYNKAPANSIAPINQSGPVTAGKVTFVSYTPYATNNDFHYATNDTGAVGNGTNWSAYFGGNKDGLTNGRPAVGAWNIGAY